MSSIEAIEAGEGSQENNWKKKVLLIEEDLLDPFAASRSKVDAILDGVSVQEMEIDSRSGFLMEESRHYSDTSSQKRVDRKIDQHLDHEEVKNELQDICKFHYITLLFHIFQCILFYSGNLDAGRRHNYRDAAKQCQSIRWCHWCRVGVLCGQS